MSPLLAESECFEHHALHGIKHFDVRLVATGRRHGVHHLAYHIHVWHLHVSVSVRERVTGLIHQLVRRLALNHVRHLHAARRRAWRSVDLKHNLFGTIGCPSGPVTLSAFARLLAATFRRLDWAVNAEPAISKIFSKAIYQLPPCRTFIMPLICPPSTVRPVWYFRLLSANCVRSRSISTVLPSSEGWSGMR